MKYDNDTNPTQNFDLDIDDMFKPLFSPEAWHDIDDAFEIQEKFCVPDIYDKYAELISRFNYEEADNVRDAFYSTVRIQVQNILTAHSINMKKDTPLRVLVDLAEVFMVIQHLEDYTHIYNLFQGNRTDEEILLALFCEHTTYDEAFILSHMQDFDPGLLTMLKHFCEKQLGYSEIETDEEVIELKAGALKNMAVMVAIYEHALGVQLASMSMLLGQPIQTYLNLTKDNLLASESDQDFAYDFVSLCLISKEQKENPYAIWAEHSDIFDISLHRAMSLSNHINSCYLTFVTHMKAANEKV